MAALKRVAALPGSWRAQLWLARNALAQDDVAAAKLFYQEALSRMDPVPADRHALLISVAAGFTSPVTAIGAPGVRNLPIPLETSRATPALPAGSGIG